MATVLPAMKGRFGSTEFFIVTMPAKELTERLVIPKDIEGWEDLTIEERYQRKIDYSRVKKQIAPYLMTDDDRFFGAFIVSMVHADDIEFELLGSMASKVPNLYKKAGSAFGFLTLEGNELLVPLDGQHRLAALGFAISGKDEKQKPIRGFEANLNVARDDCTVILVKHNNKKSRKIFNKVNRYAKKTTKSEDLITADDDVIAVIVREKIAGDVIPSRLINTGSNTLSKKATEFTTLATLYEATKFVLEDHEGKKIDTQNLPDKTHSSLWQELAVEFWKAVCDEVKIFSDALHDPHETGDQKRVEIRQDFVLGKPVAQLSLVHAIVQLRSEDPETGVRISMDEVFNRINTINWSATDPRWQHVLMVGDRVVSGRQAVNFASKVIDYWLGEKLSAEELEELHEKYKSHSDGRSLSEPLSF